MAGNSIGHTFVLTTFGESHGEAIGGVIDGVPSNFELDLEVIQLELNRRKPGQSEVVTQRKEPDKARFLSGIFEGKTTGSPIGFVIENSDQKPKDYKHLENVYRPSHADFTYEKKYGHRDFRGGGRSSARETACRVVAGAIAKQFLNQLGVKVEAFVSQIGSLKLEGDLTKIPLPKEENIVRCPDQNLANRMIDYIKDIRKEGDTIGGVVFCKITGTPIGLGMPVFDKLHADLAKAMLSINAVKGFDYGSGFSGVEMRGSQHNDAFQIDGSTSTNYSGGVQGGISNGEPIYFRVAFKPVATIMREQMSIDSKMKQTVVEGKGRHDPCVVPRAVPIVEAMAAITVFDHYLCNKKVQF